MPMKSPHVIWASVTIIIVLIGGAVTLTLAGKDVEGMAAAVKHREAQRSLGVPHGSRIWTRSQG